MTWAAVGVGVRVQLRLKGSSARTLPHLHHRVASATASQDSGGVTTTSSLFL